MDGVITDTAKFHYEAWGRLAREKIGFTLTPAQNEQLKGVSRKGSLNILLELGNRRISEEDFEAWCELKNGWYLDLIKTMSPADILPGVMEFLAKLKAKGIKLAVGSASKNCIAVINSLKIADEFDAIVDGNDVTKTKPDPEVFLLSAKRLGVPPQNSIVFEDAVSGIDAALAGDFWSVGVGKESELSHAHKVIPGFDNINPEEILNIPLKHKAKKI